MMHDFCTKEKNTSVGVLSIPRVAILVAIRENGMDICTGCSEVFVLVSEIRIEIHEAWLDVCFAWVLQVDGGRIGKQ